MPTALEDYTEIGRLTFKIAGTLNTNVELTARSDGSYMFRVPDLDLNFEQADRADALGFVQALDGNPTAMETRFNTLRKTSLQARIDADTQIINDIDNP